MCYSATASFVGGAVISAVGVASVNQSGKPSRLAFAGIPLLFGFQQITEGFLWLALTDPGYAYLEKIGTTLFLIMARIVWPAMIPLAVLLMEEGAGNRRLQYTLLGMGLSVSAYYTWCLLFLNVTPNIAGHHIQYISNFPEWLATPVFLVYFIAVIVPLFVASNKRVRLLGALMFLSCLVTVILKFAYLTSVWCFFAAIISVVVFWILKEPVRALDPSPVPEG
jgi:hypothetical protein